MSLRVPRFPVLTEWSYGLRRQQGTKRNVRIAEASRVDFGPPVNRLPYRSHVTAVVHEQPFRNTNAMAVDARSVISTIIRRESHWQSRVLRNDRHGAGKARGIRSLSGQLGH